jgi:hypothetical protein
MRLATNPYIRLAVMARAIQILQKQQWRPLQAHFPDSLTLIPLLSPVYPQRGREDVLIRK